MLWFGHLALGYLVTKFLLQFAPSTFSTQEVRLLITFGMIAALLPDMDLIPFFIKHRSIKLQKKESHRKIWSHAPLLWISIILVLLVFTAQSLFTLFAGIVLLGGSWSHFLGDSIEYGVFWLWPFSGKKWRLREARGSKFSSQKTSILRYYITFFTQVYVKNWTFWIESVTILLALFVIFWT